MSRELNGIRYEIKEDFFFMRNIDSGMVVEAIFKPKMTSKIMLILENPILTFSKKWDNLIQIKGLNVTSRSY